MQSAPETSDGLVGRRIGPYLLLERLGVGAMGTVYRARDLFLGRTVALKVHKKRPGEQGLRRFLQEARAAEALAHPNLSGTIDAGSEGDFYFHAMELVSGTTLAAIVKGGPIPWPDALAIALQMSAGLAAAHAAGVMHRDLKPSNVMIGREGAVKLVDFGLAKQIEAIDPGDGNTIVDWQSVQTSPGAVLGTPAYMAPEQASGRPVDARSDVFSLGVTIWEMVTGQPLFRRSTPAQTLRAILGDPAPRLDVAAPGTPKWLADVVVRCVEKEPLLRHGDGSAVWQRLDEGRASDPESNSADLAGLVLRTIGPRISIAPPPFVPATVPHAARNAAKQGPFIGRVEELNRLDAFLSRGARLVSIVGTGGVGKTRLAAEYVLRESGEPVVWVDLSSLSREGQLLEAMAYALGLSEREASLDRIERRLAERAGGLVVLDGFERLVPEGLATLSRWVEREPDRATNKTQFLLTSRVLVPLATDHAIELDGLASDEALELFAAHLERLAPGVPSPDTNQLEHLARALESNPLAIALTAARVAEDGLSSVMDRVARTTQILDSYDSQHDGVPLRTAIEASFHLLPPTEQHLAVSLAVFDTFDVPAVEALLEAPRERKIGDQIRALAHGGILRAAAHPDQLAVPRYALEDAVRSFVERELAVRGDRDTLETRHAAYYANVAKRWIDLLRSDPARESWREILAERGNLLAAGRRALVARTELWLGLGLRAVASYAIAAIERTGDRAHVPLLASLLDAGEAIGAPNGAVHAEASLAYAEAIASRDEARAEAQLRFSMQISPKSSLPFSPVRS
ncbi:MAG: protein kinase, partial [Deltaproteobacteria bacterium]|nr:protein kinase [Deltaproteobacteria bacterium]